ncbi:hypothetical protein C6V04_10570 [Burkholderia multivorans]|nr:hypothetical protein C6V04_10570 [Burkholderia multivorans]
MHARQHCRGLRCPTGPNGPCLPCALFERRAIRCVRRSATDRRRRGHATHAGFGNTQRRATRTLAQGEHS